MNTNKLRLFACLWALTIVSAAGADFLNLGFESATLVHVETGYQSSVEAGQALSSWSSYWGTGPAPYVSYDARPLDSTGIGILDSSAPDWAQTMPLAGNYSVLLQGGFLGGVNNRQPAAIGQTGLFPEWAKSISFEVRGSGFEVSVDGEALFVRALQTNSSSIVYAADIEAFSGTEAELRFTAFPIQNIPGYAVNDVFLDSIAFSSTPIPEPGTSVLVLFGTACLFLTNCPRGRRG